jgi:site-specific recombinase XerD
VQQNNAHAGALKRTEFKKLRIYDLRHIFASGMAMAGVDLVTLRHCPHTAGFKW